MLAGAAGFVMIEWQRAEIVSAKQELIRLEERVQTVAATVAETEKRGRELDARDMRFETSTCLADNQKKRLCVEIDPKSPNFTSSDGGRQFLAKGVLRVDQKTHAAGPDYCWP